MSRVPHEAGEAGEGGLDADWNHYVESFHRNQPGITEDVLRDGRYHEMDPYAWLLAAVASTSGPVVDLGCGSAPIGGAFTHWIGVDRSAEELRVARDRDRSPLVRATAAALPMRSATCDTVLGVMSLQVLRPLDAVMDEVGRVLRPGGQLVVLLPARRPVPARDVVFYARLQRRLGRTIGNPNDDQLDGQALIALTDAHGFAVEDDVRAGFTLPLQSRADAERLVHSLYLPGVTPQRVARALALVERRVGRSVTVPLRRVALRRHTRTADRDDPAWRGDGARATTPQAAATVERDMARVSRGAGSRRSAGAGWRRPAGERNWLAGGGTA